MKFMEYGAQGNRLEKGNIKKGLLVILLISGLLFTLNGTIRIKAKEIGNNDISLSPSKYILDWVEDVPLSQTIKKHWFPVPSGSLVDQGESFIQPETGHRITRISDIKDNFRFDYMGGDPSQGLTNGYSRFANSNINEEYALAYSTDQAVLIYRLSDGKPLGLVEYKEDRFIGESCNPRWDLSGRNGTETIIYYHIWEGTKIYKQDILEGYSTQEAVYNFSERILPEDHMDQDRYARYRAVRLENQIAVLDLRKKEVLPGKISSSSLWGCDISTEGKWLYVQGFNGTQEVRFYKILELAQGNISNYSKLPCKSHGHDGWAYDNNGNEVYIFQDNTNDWFSAYNPETGNRIDIIHMSEAGWTFGQHMGRIYNPQKGGWLLMSTYDVTNDSWVDNQIFMLEVKSHEAIPKPRIWRIASTHNLYDDNYFAEAFACISPDGNNIYWGANWMGQDNLELYRVELPRNWHEVLNAGPAQINPPLNLSGKKVLNRAFFYTEYINVLEWEANPDNVNIVKYRIYEVKNRIEHFLTGVGSNNFKYLHRNLEKEKEYNYAIRAVTADGKEGKAAYITVM